MSNVTLLGSSSLPGTPGYAYASSIDPGARVVHLAGACPLDEDGSVTLLDDFAGQTSRCIENLLTALAEVGGSLRDVAYTRVLVASARREDLAEVWGVVREAFADHEVPSTLLGVTVLGYEHQLVEIEAVAAVGRPDQRGKVEHVPITDRDDSA